MECPASLPVRRRAWRSSGGGAVLASALVVCSIVGSAAPSAIAAASSAFEPASTGGVEVVDRGLARLGAHRRLLMVGAHPDDEDTRLLARLGRYDGTEVAYLSLTRGEGGQNLIGTELGDGLGLLRSRELLAARAIDGARQLFTRAYDFGYTRSVEESLDRWGEAELLDDIVRAIRRFRPQVVVSVWPDDARAGHGHHQAAGRLSVRAFAAAGEAATADRGLPPWAPEALFRPAWRDTDTAVVVVDLGVVDPHGGRSAMQLAAASRSQHRSQDMGALQPLGAATGRYLRLDREATPGTDLFAGIDTRLEAIATPIADPALRTAVADRLRQVAGLAATAREQLVPARLARAAEPLGRIVGLLVDTRSALAQASPDPGARHAFQLVEEKLTIAEAALAAAAGVAVDAWSDHGELVPRSRVTVETAVWNAGPLAVEVAVIEMASPAGLAAVHTGADAADEPSGRFRLAARPTRADRFEVEVPGDAPPTVPYFLRAPRVADRYPWTGAPRAVRGQPFGPPPLTARFRLEVEGVPLTLEREVVHRFADQERGEVREPLRVVPAFEVRLEPEQLVWSRHRSARPQLTAELRSRLDRTVRARLTLRPPADWPPIEPIELELPAGGSVRVPVALRLPPAVASGQHAVRAELVVGGRRFERAFDRVAYPHVVATPLPVAARTTVHVGTIALPALSRVAYLRGASDRVPEALAAVGVPIEVVDAASLVAEVSADGTPAAGLARFDAVVIGSRAYETDPELAALDPALDAYLRKGGTVIVQYQQYGYARGRHAPYPFDLRRPHDRTTDEDASVRLLQPGHPALRRPNAIERADWDGWVQERGLYFAGTWDDAYTPLLAMPDPEGVERSGALLVARVGEGWFVYTGLAFFRQLPAGVVGAYRLFANLLALGSEDE